jgi:hypothetical protein
MSPLEKGRLTGREGEWVWEIPAEHGFRTELDFVAGWRELQIFAS